MGCKFVEQLARLRKLSAESVDNTNAFDEFKEYIHVERPVERELRNLLRKLNKTPQKRLVLLCGSAGDGKSHLLSYLKNIDSEKLLEDYELYNDATESSAPNLTSIDTLADKLQDYDDEHYLIDDGKKMILAINLGTLSNFIESEKGKRFSALKQYVDGNDIFDGFADVEPYEPTPVFHHINFSDYQMFTLRENGVGTDYLEALLEKVFNREDDNPFYETYKANENCTLCQRCPVRHNYEFMLKKQNQKAIIDKIVEIIIKDKTIVSTREVLNFLYDILVHPEFSYNSFCGKITSDIKYLPEYIQYTTPMLLYEYEGISMVIDHIKKHDLLKERKSNMDLEATRFHSLDNIEEAFLEATANTPYELLRTITDISVLGGIKPELKKLVYRFIVRLKEIKGEYNEIQDKNRFSEYIRYLYYQSSLNENKLRKVYESTKKAIMHWNGHFESDYICIDETNEQYWVLEQLYLKSAIKKANPIDDEEIMRFSTLLRLKYKKDNGTDEDCADASIDYALYEMICDMSDGYRPTVQDKNRHADFVSFIQRLMEYGNKSSRITLIPKDINLDYKIVFEETEFDFEFKVV